jgi:hypothetical protein
MKMKSSAFCVICSGRSVDNSTEKKIQLGREAASEILHECKYTMDFMMTINMSTFLVLFFKEIKAAENITGPALDYQLLTWDDFKRVNIHLSLYLPLIKDISKDSGFLLDLNIVEDLLVITGTNLIMEGD